jgi:Protein of unknown function (DUF3040)
MSLPDSQQRALAQIEKMLANDDPGLGPLFTIFTRLTGHEAMPLTERVTVQPREVQPPRGRLRMWPAVVTIIWLAMATGTLLALSLLLPSPRVCAPGAVTPVAARAQSVLTGSQTACASQQNKPSKTSP